MSKPELLPCPFCGDKSVPYNSGNYVECQTCNYWMPLEKWNRRTPVAPTQPAPTEARETGIGPQEPKFEPVGYGCEGWAIGGLPAETFDGGFQVFASENEARNTYTIYKSIYDEALRSSGDREKLKNLDEYITNQAKFRAKSADEAKLLSGDGSFDHGQQVGALQELASIRKVLEEK